MFRNYFLTALRNIARHRLYSFINIAGLAVGLTCVIFIMLFVRDELSYDKWIAGGENLYRIESTISEPGRPPHRGTKIPFPVVQAMLQQIPEVKSMTRLVPQSATVMIGSRQFLEKMTVVDPGFFQVIRLPLLQGNPATVFTQPESVVLSQVMVRKYFGDAPAMGKTIIISGETCDEDGTNCQASARPLVVTGIMRDLPHNTQLKGDIFIPNTSAADPMSQREKQGWMWFVGWGYVTLAPGADPAAVETKLKAVIDHSLDPKKMTNLNIRGSEWLVPHVAPFRDDHLSTDRFEGLVPGGSWEIIYGFAAIGGLILLMACFNFMNLSTARATLRAREISLRKVMGASRRQLVMQFLGESLLVALVALVFALALVEILLPSFNSFLGKAVALHYLADWPLVAAILGITVLAGLLSGIYPALVLSGFRPAATLRTSSSALSGSGLLRATLVVLQFAVSIGLGIAVAVVFAQISFSRNIALGYQKDGVVIVNASDVPSSVRDNFMLALRANPGISATAISDTVPLANRTIADNLTSPGGRIHMIIRVVAVSPDFMDLYNVRLLSGRMLSRSRGADQHHAGTPLNVLLNATAARSLGLTPLSALGKTFTVHDTPVSIAGVVDDIKMDGPKQSVTATLYRYDLDRAPFVSVRVRAAHLPDTLAFIDKTWHAVAPTVAIRRSFLSDNFASEFQADEKQGAIFGLFVGIAIFIACLGLFGLAAFTAGRRTKEISIRKVFGARNRDVIFLLLRQFSIPVLIANVIAWPLAWYYLHEWLQSFADRISLNPLYFAGIGLAALLIAWATIFAHALHVARANPINALRAE